MRKIVFCVLLVAVSLSVMAWENHDWITEYNWYIEMDDVGDYVYWKYIQYGKFGKAPIMPEDTVYRGRLRNEIFEYFYERDQGQIFLLGCDADSNRIDNQVDMEFRDNYSYLRIKNGLYLIGGNRNGGQYDPKYPIVGVWGQLPWLSEIRLVESGFNKSGETIYYLNIGEEIPGFAVRHGTYLFKQIGDNIFETDSSFPDGRMRLEIRNKELLVLTPLFELPDEEGLVEPLHLRQLGKIEEEIEE